MTEASDDPRQLPKRTTPTWEMELLISGATVFSLLQLPDQVDRLLFGFYNNTLPDLAALSLPLWIYVKFALLTLIATFLLHLVTRGYWVALVGLHSVYPEGVRWDRMRERLGPQYFRRVHADLSDMSTLIERADNRASLVFGVGVGLATVMFVPMLIVSLMMVAIWARWALSGGEGGGQTLLFVVLGAFGIVAILFAVLVQWDRRAGAGLVPGSPQERRMQRLFDLYAKIGFSGSGNPLLTLFSSHAGSRRTAVLITVVAVVVFTIVLGQTVGSRMGLGLRIGAGLPPDGFGVASLVKADHYDDQRGDVIQLVPPPHIPSRIIAGDWLPLFIPYIPTRHDEFVARDCAIAEPTSSEPDATADAGEPAEAGRERRRQEREARRQERAKYWRERLDCLARLHLLAIDGEPVAVPFDAGEDPRTGQRGLVAMLPIADLPRGRHELTVGRLPRNHGEDPPDPWRILFWKSE
ncbi:hypothetical protein [Arenimonas composti]|uniref:Uncharacterized protein n=1 Tax=Arenimonas composti TR7-09 = DSM 18010 TaxID=1121013 RepID=A0A091BG79_9GAMM|nr:hypothetical protein [Arenimonas composti]KFN49809.1 hypothetical protein P873_09645 [Arenimonas composti TR7-09 = DSM 18010]